MIESILHKTAIYYNFLFYPTENSTVEAGELQNLYKLIISYSSNVIFERRNQVKIHHNNKNILNKKPSYLKNDKYVTPFLNEEKILLNSSNNNFSGTLNRRYSYSYEGAYENAPKYKNIYGYEEDKLKRTPFSSLKTKRIYKTGRNMNGTSFLMSRIWSTFHFVIPSFLF